MINIASHPPYTDTEFQDLHLDGWVETEWLIDSYLRLSWIDLSKMKRLEGFLKLKSVISAPFASQNAKEKYLNK